MTSPARPPGDRCERCNGTRLVPPYEPRSVECTWIPCERCAPGLGERVPVQADGLYYLSEDDRRRVGSHPPGTVEWGEHVMAWRGYGERFPGSALDQDAVRIAQRGGFGYNEMTEYLGHEPTTWRAR